MAGFVFQPKPEGDRHLQINISYKRIIEERLPEIKNLESLAALLSVLEYLAKCSLVSSNWKPSDPLPNSVQIRGDCNFPRLDALLDGWLKPTSMRDKLNLLDAIGFISIDTSTNRRRRFITYHRGEIGRALANINSRSHPPKNGASGVQSPNFGDSDNPPKFGDSKIWGVSCTFADYMSSFAK